MIAAVHAACWDYLELGHKVNFDPFLKLVTVAPDVSEINVQQDLYSDGKEFMALRNNRWVRPPLRASGGDPVPGQADPLGTTFFMANGWRIKLTHAVRFDGNLFSDNYTSPFVVEAGVLLATNKVSNLISALLMTDNVVTGDINDIAIPSAADNALATRVSLMPDFAAIPTDAENAAAILAAAKATPIHSDNRMTNGHLLAGAGVPPTFANQPVPIDPGDPFRAA